MQKTERSGYTVQEICNIIGVACTVPDAEVKCFYFRNTRFHSACAYFTVKGEQFDGHIFDEAQLKEKAVVVFSDKTYEGLPCIFVENPLDAFVRFAEAARLRFPAKAVAVTGSIGKTSTKEMIHAALQASALALKTRDTNNSSIESAYLISQLNQDHRFFVVEMGLRRPNQCFVRNSAMVKPDVCILTNIGNSHIENFRDKAHILEEKYLIN